MSSKGKIVRFLGGAFLSRAAIVCVEDIGGFRRLVMQADAPAPRAGAKVQLLLPSDDMRTYTPVASKDGFELLGWKHAGGPGSRWLSEVTTGTTVRFVGPQRSLELPPGKVVLIGDETSVAVAASLERDRPGEVQALLQVRSPDDVQAAAGAIGLQPVVVPRGELRLLVDTIVAARKTAPDACVALTGGSELVLGVRNALNQRGIDRIKTKTYWVPGKTGLD
ncbi:MAG TPA: hypothetical protein VEI94_16550 [Candidatus Bathyarchaeia archaeon]|nr:hypothetical protein [Candidatus Bathyarchaeia archaeon]